MKPFSLTLAGVVVLIGLGILAAVFIGTDSNPDDQRFLILIGIIGTTITALLAVIRSEANANRIEESNKTVVETVDNRAAEVTKRAAQVERVALDDLAEVKAKIDHNTEISAEAFRAANNYAERLNETEAELNARFERLLGEADPHVESVVQVQDREAGDIRRVQDRKAGVVRRSEHGDDA